MTYKTLSGGPTIVATNSESPHPAERSWGPDWAKNHGHRMCAKDSVGQG